MRVIELFAGAGGMALGFHRAGWETVALAEWDPHAQCVLRARFPDVPLYGDVRDLDGRALIAAHGAVDLVSGGAPCQDLSVAGKREGLQGDRSILFYDLIRIWEETGAPYCLYENVLGALNSQKGADFAAVLSAFVGRAVAVPRDGWTGGGGVVAGPTGVAAWRVLDAQFFGVPQRRRRVFVLGARPGAVDPAEILLECDGLSWDSPSLRQAGEDFDDVAQDGAGDSGWPARIASTLDCSYGTKFGYDDQHVNAGRPLFVVDKHSGQVENGLVSPTIKTDLAHDMGPVVVVQPSVVGSLTAKGPGTYGAPEIDAGHILVNMPSLAVNISNGAASLDEMMGTLGARSGGSEVGAQTRGVVIQPAIANVGRPRRLMPIECERLMGWEDGWTDVPEPKGKPMADSHRYKMCGNGVVSHCAEWIARRIAELEND